MTNNVLRDVNIGQRAPLMIKNYNSQSPDALGLQECDDLAYQTVVEPLSDSGYAVAGASVEADGALSHTPILYNGNRFELLEEKSDYFTHRYTNSKTYSFAVLKERQSDKIFAVINVHFANIIGSYPKEIGTDEQIGNVWRKGNADQCIGIAKYISQKYGDIPVFLMGDFNCDSRQAPLRILSAYFDDTLKVATEYRSTPTATYHPVGSPANKDGLPCDCIFSVKDRAEIISCEIIDDKDMIDSTDHLAVIASVAF